MICWFYTVQIFSTNLRQYLPFAGLLSGHFTPLFTPPKKWVVLFHVHNPEIIRCHLCIGAFRVLIKQKTPLPCKRKIRVCLRCICWRRCSNPNTSCSLLDDIGKVCRCFVNAIYPAKFFDGCSHQTASVLWFTRDIYLLDASTFFSCTAPK